MSRIVSGKIRLDVQPVELPLIVDNAVSTIQPAADAKGVRVQTLVDPRVGHVSGDPGRLLQVVWNLVSNAVKFTPKNGRVQVRLERVNSHVEIVVSDTGMGISPDFLPYVFDRFRQAEAGTTRKTGGLGLGLAIVRHIVEMHGGTVEASSAGEGKGATFRVRLPLMIVHPEAVKTRREHPRTERREALTGLADLSGVRVFAIDDEEDALTLLRVVMEAAGAEVTTLNSPVTALERIAEVNPRAGRRSRHAGNGRVRADHASAQVAEPGDSTDSSGGADGVRAIRRPNQGAARWLRDAPRQAGGPWRAGGFCREARAKGRRRTLAHVCRVSRLLFSARAPCSIKGTRLPRSSSGRKSVIQMNRQDPGPASTICIDAWW